MSFLPIQFSDARSATRTNVCSRTTKSTHALPHPLSTSFVFLPVPYPPFFVPVENFSKRVSILILIWSFRLVFPWVVSNNYNWYLSPTPFFLALHGERVGWGTHTTGRSLAASFLYNDLEGPDTGTGRGVVSPPRSAEWCFVILETGNFGEEGREGMMR